ncbi:PREDICTED: uncharacterized protein LOC109584621 [Amphimedon queenslandica]|uniref:Uncharacterized protein n=1 Tax=Amphimedon queenslandica TaxID=400682 RepID=A0A1X7U6C1_AMPQE|nr:PREDICTED: uncharacterized protein LOC109584621 [Amphimedon queenslandica]|eukprot:XP_019855999.1 PREDICTED: uncharacterized protein LOC109584621 [Amphimedon queenslandica]
MAATLRFELLYVPVRRIERSRLYNPKNYEIGLIPSVNTHSLPSYQIRSNEENFKLLVSSRLKEEHQISALSVHSLATLSSKDRISIMYIVPTISTEANVGGIRFIDMFSLIQTPQLLGSHRELLLVIDQWLMERHSLPYSNPDLLFSTDSTGQSLVGIVQDIVDNPLLSIPSEPPEDKLIIALNNPVFVPIEDTTNF